MRFEWDEEKAKINKKKHGIDFRSIVGVFNDENALYLVDDAHSFGEERYAIIGFYGKVIFVSYTEREDVIRIISARLATEQERRWYYGQDSYF